MTSLLRNVVHVPEPAFDAIKEVNMQQKKIQRPIRRTDRHTFQEEGHEIWPMSAREFMKLPASSLVVRGNRRSFHRDDLQSNE